MKKYQTLLIIDDEQDICLLLERILKRHYQVVASSHLLADGLEKAHALRPSHILLDNNLPDGYGVEAIQRLKVLAPASRVVVISAVDVASEATKAGADAFVDKPINLAAIKQALDLSAH
ncbi:MAG: response regulator [Saprospiraceae bacterium]